MIHKDQVYCKCGGYEPDMEDSGYECINRSTNADVEL
jgi:hypothetical protein